MILLRSRWSIYSLLSRYTIWSSFTDTHASMSKLEANTRGSSSNSCVNEHQGSVGRSRGVELAASTADDRHGSYEATIQL